MKKGNNCCFIIILMTDSLLYVYFNANLWGDCHVENA
jgi:hypothetical protein